VEIVKKETLLEIAIVIMITAMFCMVAGFMVFALVDMKLGCDLALGSVLYFGIGSGLRKIYYILKERDEKGKP